MCFAIVLNQEEAVGWLSRAIIWFGPSGLKCLSFRQTVLSVDEIQRDAPFWKLAIAVVEAAKRVKELDASAAILSNYYTLLAIEMVQTQTQVNQHQEQVQLFERLRQAVIVEEKLRVSACRINTRNRPQHQPV
jgi:hypothetical protein